MRSIGGQVDVFYNAPFQVSASANIVNASFEEMQKSVFRSISTENPNVIDKAINDAKGAADTIAQQMQVIEERFGGDPQLVAGLKN